ncbi:hypothetical protein FVB9288_01765 [Flavobacterium sp. CECT 9288]|uniref:M23 family metallopeptidase n=1 Tax=Flavobacterium sp. CECT 9288 TaxID=2845819 RepID=UPI001E5B1B1D|nr:M23 family metallopeptidase [Flavobacterium sp. CECT 9288]CAH0336091.1 hypothetical protein FVB9288_01765 [Flavobacterium sp. CECT 9288]
MVHPTVTEANWTDATGTPKTTSGFIGEINYVKATVPNFCNEEVRIYFHVKAHKDNAYYKNRYFITTKTDSEGKINTAVSFSKEMKAKLGISNWNVNLKFALVGIVDNQLYAFKGISYPVSNSELKVTTKKEILDLYFEYKGKRLVPTDRVPYNSKTPTKIKMVAHTRNMIGEKIKFTAHALKDDSILENLNESTIKANGITELSFQKKAPAHLKKDDTETYYAGVEGFSTKHFKDKTLVFKVGAKLDSGDVFDKNDPQLVWGAKVSKEFRLKVVKICKNIEKEKEISFSPNTLMNIMAFETANTFSPSAGTFKADPRDSRKGGFVGLIQFGKEAAEGLNIKRTELMKMTAEKQLDYVEKWFLLKSKSQLKSATDIYLSVNYPKAAGKGHIDKEPVYGDPNAAYRANKPFLREADEINEKGKKIGKVGGKTYVWEVREALEENYHEGEYTRNIWYNPLKKMELRGWYRSGWLPNESEYLLKTNVRDSGMHQGLDLYAPVGTTVYACVDGVRVRVGPDVSETYGKTITIKGFYEGKEYYFFYAHLSERRIKIGDKVKAGDIIGETGKTGNANNLSSKMEHLHFEVRNKKSAQGAAVEPFKTIKELKKNVKINPDKNTQI